MLGTPAPPLDPEQLALLREGLRTHNLHALKLYAELEPALVGSYGVATTVALSAAMRHLRFDEVLGLLDTGGDAGVDGAQNPDSSLLNS